MKKTKFIFQVSILLLISPEFKSQLFNYTDTAKSSVNYLKYYQKQNVADSLIYLVKDFKSGFSIYRQLFEEYDFVWLEDCMRLVQLSLLYSDDKMLDLSFRKAFENGLELDKIRFINRGCPCTFYSDYKLKVGLLDQYVKENTKKLEKLFREHRKDYLRRMDTSALVRIIEGHVKDELFKVYKKEMNIPFKQFRDRWDTILFENYKFISASYFSGKYIGAINTGYYSEQLMYDLDLRSASVDHLKNKFYEKYNLVEDSCGEGYSKIPTVSDDYFKSGSPLFITYYHDMERFYRLLTKHYKNLVKGGYLHPKEYAVIAQKLNRNEFEIHPIQLNKAASKFHEINMKRRAYYLPSIEIDIAKHNFGHENKLQLFFGFFNATR